jgi:hypothetical protein
MRFYKYTLLFFIAMIASTYAFSTASIFSVGQCKQVNASYLVCPDGIPIKVSFSISAPYAPPYMGNFSVYPIQYWNTSEVTNIYNGRCIVPASETTTCFVTLNAIPIATSNGIANRQIELKLVSSAYPQMVFNESLNITIQHYETSGEQFIENLYNTTSSMLYKDNYTYTYFCSIYSICSTGISSNMTYAARAIANARSQLYNSMLEAAYANITLANATLYNMLGSFSSFANTSNLIVSTDIKARYLLTNSTNAYYKHEKELYNCTFSNGTRYSSYIGNAIKGLNNYSTLNTLNGADAYLNLSTRLNANETMLIRSCISGYAAPISIKLPIGFNLLLYLFAAVIVILLVYAALRFIDSRTVSKMREAPDAKDEGAGKEAETGIQEAAGAGDIGIKEIPQSNEEGIESKTTEGYFDNWFSSTISKEPGEDSSKESKQSSPKSPQDKHAKGKKQQ